MEASWNEYKLTFNACVSCRNTHNIALSRELAKTTSVNKIIMSILI